MPDLDFVIAEFQERSLPDCTPRITTFPQVARKAAVVIGMRRSASACKCQASPKPKTYGRNANPESASLIEVAPLGEDGMAEVRSTD